MTPKEIAEKYVYGKHDALTDKQEIKDMIKDIEAYAEHKVKNSSIPDVMNTEESLNKMNSSEAIWLIESKEGYDVYKGGKCLISGASEEDLNKLHINI